MGIVLYLGGCTICGAALAWLRERGLPFDVAGAEPATADER